MLGLSQNMQILVQGLQNLKESELQELDAAVTPRTAHLLTKAFGPEIQQILTPLTENDSEHIPAGDPNADQQKALPSGSAEAFSPGSAEEDEEAEIAAAEEALRRLMRDPRYYRDRDPTVVNMVTEGFKRLYPEGARFR